MKNHHSGLFFIGVMIGGGLMLLAIGSQFLPGIRLSIQPARITESAEDGPRLIALEATGLPPKPVALPIIPTSTIQTNPTPVSISPRLSPTPLFLLREQKPEIIGYSTEGRSLSIYTFGSGRHERMIVAGIHGGDEWNTITLANQMIEYLNQYPTMIPEEITLYILPNLNPDGEARSHDKYGRLNQNGVDLNRNFPVNWQSTWNRGGCWNYLPSSGGAGPGSEAETQALMDFISSHHIEALISYHSAALGIFPGGDPWDENSLRLAKSIAQVSAYPFPPLDTGCKYSGTLPDFAVSKGIAAIDIELTNHIDTDFEMNLNILEVLLNWQSGK